MLSLECDSSFERYKSLHNLHFKGLPGDPVDKGLGFRVWV